MKIFIKIYKAMFLWATMFSTVIFIFGLESMIEESRYSLMLVWLPVNIIFIWMCRMQLTYKDVYKLSGTYWFESIIKK